MAYVDKGGQASRKTAIVGVAAIHAIIGTLLITGLAGVAFTPDEDKPFIGTQVPLPPVPPPPPDPTDDVKPDTPQRDPTIFAPDPPIKLTIDDPPFNITQDPPPPGPEIVKKPQTPLNPGLGADPLPPPPLFDPIAATPRNDVSRWVTTDDYRTVWINREMTGTARFSVTVGTNGKVQDCRIVSSTGHPALDNATCRLVKRRARFEAARDSDGRIVTDTFTKSVSWRLPE